MQTGHEMHPSFFIDETQSRLNPDYRARNRVRPTTSPEITFDLSLPGDIRRLASTCTDSQGITLNEFINRAIAEKLYPVDQKNLKNSLTRAKQCAPDCGGQPGVTSRKGVLCTLVLCPREPSDWPILRGDRRTSLPACGSLCQNNQNRSVPDDPSSNSRGVQSILSLQLRPFNFARWVSLACIHGIVLRALTGRGVHSR